MAENAFRSVATRRAIAVASLVQEFSKGVCVSVFVDYDLNLVRWVCHHESALSSMATEGTVTIDDLLCSDAEMLSATAQSLADVSLGPS